MLRISLVSYLNTQPFIRGLQNEFSIEEIQLNPVIPSQCARDLKEGKCDFALIPVGSMLDFPSLEIEKDFCIGAKGDVDSVFLFSRKPVQSLNRVLLDPHSRTSNGLLRILMKHYWKNDPVYEAPMERDFNLISEDTGAVVIGDAAYAIKDQFPFVYDLSGEWQRFTSLPFVFAAWASIPGTIDPEMRARLGKAFMKGWDGRHQTGLDMGERFGYGAKGGAKYLTTSIDYLFDWQKHKAFKLYLEKLKELDMDLVQAKV